MSDASVLTALRSRESAALAGSANAASAHDDVRAARRQAAIGYTAGGVSLCKRFAMSGMRRSYLFVPGNRPDRYAKACATRAHAVIVDLEDAVAPDEKDAARRALAGWLSPERRVLVRVNARASEWFDDDLAACAHDAVVGVVVPKAERAEDIERVASACGPRHVYPLVETARGLWNVLEIASASNVNALMFGALDFQADIGATDDDLLYARSQLVLASRVAGIDPPVDGVTQSIDDQELLRRDCQRARQLGFAGKLCIHPRQVDVVNRCLAPTRDDLAWARRVVDAFAASAGNAALLDGKMVDRPVLVRAQAMLAEAARVDAAPSIGAP